MSDAKVTIGKLQGDISLMINDVDWNPEVTHKDSTMDFIEVKAMLTYAKRKLTKIAMQEGHISQ